MRHAACGWLTTVQFEPLAIEGVVLIRAERHVDERGSFERTWDCQQFEQQGLNARIVQRNVSHNRARYTLRGMHLQRAPHAEAKLVSCVRGRLFDVAVDLRADSPTFREWVGVELAAATGEMLYIAEGCAHGFLTLESDTSVEYLMSAAFEPSSGYGVRWDDPAFGIDWPAQPAVMSPRDRAWPDFGTSG